MCSLLLPGTHSRVIILQTMILFAGAGLGLGAPTEFHFDFGSGVQDHPGFVRVIPQQPYDASKGYGFLQNDTAPPAGNLANSNTPVAAAIPVTVTSNISTFAVDVPEGNYDVSIVFGSKTEPTSTTIKAESRRVMLQKVETTPGQFVTNSFTVNVRRPNLRSGGTIGLRNKDGQSEGSSLDWDNHLTLEFNGAHPGVESLTITPTTNAVTLFIAGDSTVCDQPLEPWSGWGMIFPSFFSQGVAVANHAQSGLALYSFEQQRRLVKILEEMRPGDYLFIQFGHNDQKDKSPGAGPYTSYKENLKKFTSAVREKGGIPVLVTSMERRNGKNWKDGKPEPTLADFATAARQVGEEENVPVIDLNEMSVKFYTALGNEGSVKAFVHYPPNTFPGQDKPLADDTHFNSYGAYELARCVVEGIKSKVPELAKKLVPNTGTFDPTHPDAPDSVQIPASLSVGANVKPAGS